MPIGKKIREARTQKVSPGLVYALIAALVAAFVAYGRYKPKPIDHDNVMNLAGRIRFRAVTMVDRCRSEYLAYLRGDNREHVYCQTTDVEGPLLDLETMVMSDHSAVAAVKEYARAFDTVIANTSPTCDEMNVVYNARQSANEERFREASARFTDAMRSVGK